MAIIVKWHQAPPSSPIFSRKLFVATVVLIIFIVYVSNLGKMMSVKDDDDKEYIQYITGMGKTEKFRFVGLK